MPVTAAFIAIAAVLEDLWTFVNGGDSLFGRMFNWLTDINARLKDLIHFYIQLRKLMTIGNYDEYYDNMEKEMLQGAEDWLKNRKEEQQSPEAKARADQRKAMIDKQFKDINLNPSLMDSINTLKNKVLAPIISPQKTGGDKTSAVNNINININESKTPEQTANALQTKLSDAFWQRQGGLA
jgi:hypothetical protein